MITITKRHLSQMYDSGKLDERPLFTPGTSYYVLSAWSSFGVAPQKMHLDRIYPDLHSAEGYVRRENSRILAVCRRGSMRSAKTCYVFRVV